MNLHEIFARFSARRRRTERALARAGGVTRAIVLSVIIASIGSFLAPPPARANAGKVAPAVDDLIREASRVLRSTRPHVSRVPVPPRAPLPRGPIRPRAGEAFTRTYGDWAASAAAAAADDLVRARAQAVNRLEQMAARMDSDVTGEILDAVRAYLCADYDVDRHLAGLYRLHRALHWRAYAMAIAGDASARAEALRLDEVFAHGANTMRRQAVEDVTRELIEQLVITRPTPEDVSTTLEEVSKVVAEFHAGRLSHRDAAVLLACAI